MATQVEWKYVEGDRTVSPTPYWKMTNSANGTEYYVLAAASHHWEVVVKQKVIAWYRTAGKAKKGAEKHLFEQLGEERESPSWYWGNYHHKDE